MLFLALSCYQGRPRDQALQALLRHDPTGIQLTPGNLPGAGFEDEVRRRAQGGLAFRYHHGFAWRSYRRKVYGEDGRPRVLDPDHSFHPPRARESRGWGWSSSTFIAEAAEHRWLLETMYPGYLLGTGAELELAMDLGVRLAVDISHLAIQSHHGQLEATTERRLRAYPGIEEIHVSTSRAGRDVHRPIEPHTPRLAWARERGESIPLVVESYWHRVPFDAQRRQLDLVASGGRRGATPRR